MRKTYFITGVAGLLGSHLAEGLIKQGHKVLGCDNLIGGDKANLPKGGTFYKFDCIDRNIMADLLKGVDTVYHCACTAYEGLSVFSPHFITQNTLGITTSTLSASIQAGVKRFIFCSSMARYGEQDSVPFTEDMTPKPQDPYGIAKYASELLIQNLSKVHGIEYVIVAPHNIIGTHQKYDDPYRNVVSIMINRMLRGQQPVIYGDGEQMRCFSFVQDVVDPLILLDEKGMGEVFNIGPDDEFVTINELSQILAELTGLGLEPIYVPERPQEVRFANASADKAREVLGYKPKTSLREGLEIMVDYIKERGAKPFEYNLPIEIVNDLTPKTWLKKQI